MSWKRRKLNFSGAVFLRSPEFAHWPTSEACKMHLNERITPVFHEHFRQEPSDTKMNGNSRKHSTADTPISEYFRAMFTVPPSGRQSRGNGQPIMGCKCTDSCGSFSLHSSFPPISAHNVPCTDEAFAEPRITREEAETTGIHQICWSRCDHTRKRTKTPGNSRRSRRAAMDDRHQLIRWMLQYAM